MMDVLTTLVFFLLFHSFNGDLPEQKIALPLSFVEAMPRETVTISIGPENIMVQGEAVVSTTKLLDDSIGTVREVAERLRQLERSISRDPKAAAEGKEVTLLADKTVPFKVIKKIMSTCTASGYGRISLAVVQKSAKG